MQAIDISICVDSNLGTCANVSSKSMPSTYVYPCATKYALFLTTTPFSSILFLKVYFVLMIFTLSGFSTNFQMSFLTNCSNSSYIVFTQYSSCSASFIVLGSIMAHINSINQTLKFLMCHHGRSYLKNYLRYRMIYPYSWRKLKLGCYRAILLLLLINCSYVMCLFLFIWHCNLILWRSKFIYCCGLLSLCISKYVIHSIRIRMWETYTIKTYINKTHNSFNSKIINMISSII